MCVLTERLLYDVRAVCDADRRRPPQPSAAGLILARPEEILDFWFGGEEGFREAWFRRDEDFDREVRERFQEDYERATAGELDDWMASPRGTLALVLLLDQFPRNLFRDDPRAYATDGKARQVANHAVSTGLDRGLQPIERMFVYLPFEHSEDLEDQRRSVELFLTLDGDLENPEILDYALRHQRVIERFGRFPHRNEILGRATTPEEAAFLEGRGAPF